ncbi:MAG TPA: TIGR03790 family protein [Fimbriimonadales bacterium]|nr:TIGR03790 family protein [Fimbriimonadales bacterium]
MFFLLLAFSCSLLGCAGNAAYDYPLTTEKRITVAPDSRSKNVLVVYNAEDSDSIKIAKAYQKAREIPEKNLLSIRVPIAEKISIELYETKIREPIRKAIITKKLKIDFILLIRGVPIKLEEPGEHSVDSLLAIEAHPSRKQPVITRAKNEPEKMAKLVAPNPYYRAKELFDSNKYKIFLCTRLDGYTAEDALRLISNSINAKPEKGLFLLDADPNRNHDGYRRTQQTLFAARDILSKKGFQVILDEGASFIGHRNGIMGYASWGSNDAKFSEQGYRSLRFHPGAIAETFVSTSARTFKKTTGGQSLIADLVEAGITGVKGYVSEPYTYALAQVDILFDRYTSGFTLAESFYAASPFLGWKDIVIGDPLCAPYKDGNR